MVGFAVMGLYDHTVNNYHRLWMSDIIPGQKMNFQHLRSWMRRPGVPSEVMRSQHILAGS